MTAHQPDPAPGAEPERGFVLAVLPQGVVAEQELAELEELARTAGVEPIDALSQHRARPDPRSYVGKGKLAELVLEEAAVVVSPGPAYGPSGEGYFRISLTVPDDRLGEAVRRIETSLQAGIIQT